MSELAPSNESQFPADAFDAVPACLAFFDLEGVLGYANSAMLKLWVTHPEGGNIRHMVQNLASAAACRLSPKRFDAVGVRWDVGACEFRGTDCTYSMQASYIGSDLFGRGSSVLISVERTATAGYPSDELLAHRFRLTAQEIRVARLLAEGKSNIQVATELSISPHTSRTHTERVLQKLEARSRAEVGSILRRQ
jgi:DNA-binding CsgD family transcriptional regulator